MLKRFFAVDKLGEAVVLFVDDTGKACYINDTAFNEPLTLEVAKSADYSNFDNCEDAEEAAAGYFTGNNLIEFNYDEWEEIIEF